ncbi:hypothetical protein [Kineosporia sp. R_H_3]|uniref:hypothetical protein n=1 Tax=Kineosporia sp. R_H_3 TaxID=1961848 RepID=UPI0018E999CB|nr:hypothetical protein [Kineosporia sp. R_H_3]
MPDVRALTRRAVTLGVLAAAGAAAATAVRGSGRPAGDDGAVLSSSGRTASLPAPGGVRTAPLPAPSATGPAEPEPEPSPAPTDRPELPRGGRVLFPRHRVVAYAGLPGAPALGRLGIGDLDARTAELEKRAAGYAGSGADRREPLPALELIAVVAQARPGRDGTYRVRVGAEVVDAHLAAARRRRALLLLNIQPGRASFLDEVRALERWLREPDVGLALDPEWAVRGRVRPGEAFGSTTGKDLDAVSAWLAALVVEHDLPEKLVVVHVLAPSVLRSPGALRRRPGVRWVRSADGIGTPAAKRRSWERVQAGGVRDPAAVEAPTGAGVLRPGFKLFLVEDERGSSRIMTPPEVLALAPAPDYVCYE